MLICQHDVAPTASATTSAAADLGHDVLQYPNLEEEEATFVTCLQKAAIHDQPFFITTDAKRLQGKQLEA